LNAGNLYTLVTDVGIAEAGGSKVIWETLNSINGTDCQYLDSHFNMPSSGNNNGNYQSNIADNGSKSIDASISMQMQKQQQQMQMQMQQQYQPQQPTNVTRTPSDEEIARALQEKEEKEYKRQQYLLLVKAQQEKEALMVAASNAEAKKKKKEDSPCSIQ
jgi:hypothetical protein